VTIDARPVALVGFGHFGRSFATLAERRRVPVRAYDPNADVPASLRAESLEALVDVPSIVVLAVPLAAVEGVLLALQPHLTSSHLVLDTCSVKREAARVMQRVLHDDVPWIATHPLFGPKSVADPNAQLRAIVCPRTTHPEATSAAKALFVRLGCDVRLLSADAHDRAMAERQALAFFVGQGLLDAELAIDDDVAPPSSSALTRLAASVTSAGSHVLRQVLELNPYAAAVRLRFLDALIKLDARSRAPAAVATETPEEVLGRARVEIDQLDEAVIRLLARRAQLALDVSRAKEQLGRPVQDLARERLAFEERRRWGVVHDLEPAFVEELFDAIMRWSRGLQERERAARAAERKP
jgi:prephenate dehydrogenase